MKKIVLIICTGLILFTNSIQAAPVTLIAQGDTWNYAVLNTDLWPIWNSVDYSSFNWENAAWQTGQAAFGSPWLHAYPWEPALPYNTFWSPNTDLALMKTVNINGIFTDPLILHLAECHGAILFINGTEIVRDNVDFYTVYWEATVSIDPSVFRQGLNTISVLTESHGADTSFFDMELVGDLQPVPEPATMLLLSAGLVSLIGFRRKF